MKKIIKTCYTTDEFLFFMSSLSEDNKKLIEVITNKTKKKELKRYDKQSYINMNDGISFYDFMDLVKYKKYSRNIQIWQ